MAIVIRKLRSLALVALAPVAVFAQDESAAMEEAIAALDQTVAEVSEFAGEVRFDEGDVRSLIDLWDEFSAFEAAEDDEDTIEFDAILGDSEYRSWAASHGLDASDWLRKTVRITMTLYREQLLAAAAMMPEQMAQQLEMVEQQREQLGEEMYQQIRQGMEATAEYTKAMMESAGHLPEPTTAEKAILEEYRDELMVLMEPGDEEEYGDYGEYEDDEGYEDDVE